MPDPRRPPHGGGRGPADHPPRAAPPAPPPRRAPRRGSRPPRPLRWRKPMLSHTHTDDAIRAEDRHGAHNSHPLPVVLASGEGVWVYDVEGRRYFDALSAYS